ncbi:MAG: Holliday junction branch migration protein RuvA [Patescibacteria group bacterium]
MIYSLKGKVVQKSENYLVLEVGNIGYQIFVSDFLLAKVKIGQEIKLWTFLYLREETLELYGFESEDELDFFKELNAVPNIGPKSAISVLSVIKISDLRRAILNESYETLTKVFGIGRKTAERIIIEMKGKIEKGFGMAAEETEDKEVIDALVQLGYSLREAREVIRKIPEDVKGAKNRLKEALKLISR